MPFSVLLLQAALPAVGWFAVGAVSFWLLLVCFFLIEIVLTEHDHPLWAAWFVVILFSILAAHGSFNCIEYGIHHPVVLFEIFIAYVGIGSFWGVVKWWRFVVEAVERVNARRDEFMRRGHVKEFNPDQQRLQWTNYMRNYHLDELGPPNPRVNKERILVWMIYWPCSMIWTLINDPLRRCFNFAYEQLSGVFETISRRMWKNVSDTLQTKQDVEDSKE